MKSVHALKCEECEYRDEAIFCDLEKFALGKISENKVTNTFQKGQTIFFQGNPSFGIYCVNKGKIKISRIATNGKESIVRIASSGDIIGHRSLFSNENCAATATVIEDATICFIDKEYLYQTLQRQPSIALNLIERLSKEMGQAEARSTALSFKTVRERLAELFVTLVKNYGTEEDEKIRLNIKLTREEFASMVGTANETIIRCISEFKDEGIIEQNGKAIYIKDESRLIEVANLGW